MPEATVVETPKPTAPPAKLSEQQLDAEMRALIKQRPDDPDGPVPPGVPTASPLANVNESNRRVPALNEKAKQSLDAEAQAELKPASTEPAPMDPAEVVRLARERAAKRMADKRPPAAATPDPQAQVAEALKLLSEKLGPSQTKAEIAEQGIDVSLRRLSRETGLPPSEIYKKFTEEMHTGRGFTAPRAPASPEAALAQQAMARAEKAEKDLEEFKAQVYGAAEQSQKQREEFERQQAEQSFQTELRSRWEPWLAQPTVEKQFPYVARMAKANRQFVLDSLALGTQASVDAKGQPLPGLTPEKLLGNLNSKLRENYLALGGTEAKQPTVEQPAVEPSQSVSTQTTAQPKPKAKFVIPPQYRGMRFKDDEDARLTIEAMEMLKQVPNPE